MSLIRRLMTQKNWFFAARFVLREGKVSSAETKAFRVENFSPSTRTTQNWFTTSLSA